MTSRVAKERAEIESRIEEARDSVGETIDQLDRRIRERFDIGRVFEDFAPHLMATGAVVGLLVGYGVPRAATRLIQLGVPVALAVGVVARSRSRCRTEADDSTGEELPTE